MTISIYLHRDRSIPGVLIAAEDNPDNIEYLTGALDHHYSCLGQSDRKGAERDRFRSLPFAGVLLTEWDAR